MKSVLTRNGKRRFLIKGFLLACLAGSIFFFLQNRREILLNESRHFVESLISRGTDFNVKIGSMSGNLFGFVSFQDVEARESWFGQEVPPAFKAKEIQLHYRFLDFLSKKFDSDIELTVRNPEIRWAPRIRLKKPNFPFMRWMHEWAVSRRRQLVIRVEDLSFIFGVDRKEMKGIDIFYKNNSFQLEIPISHISMAESDVTSLLKVKGHLARLPDGNDALIGHIHTEGTVINWKPLPEESKFDFIFTEDYFRLVSSNFLGGIGVTGEVDFKDDFDLDFSIEALAYPLDNLSSFLAADAAFKLQGHMDLDIQFTGSPWAPQVNGRTRIYRGWVSRRDFKAMDLNMAGVYPTVKLEGSRILMEDGTAMRLADRTLEVKDLFKEKTYESLVAEAQQETVVWGDWEFSRPKDAQDQSEFLMQRVLGDKARVHLREYNDRNEAFDSIDSKRVEVGFEYRLRSKDSLKLELREDEEFVGIERKLKF